MKDELNTKPSNIKISENLHYVTKVQKLITTQLFIN